MTALHPWARPAAIAAMAAALCACNTMSPRQQVVRTPVDCSDRTVQVYFDPQSAELTKEGRAVITAAARGAQSCRVASVEVIGLADAAGTPDASLEVSQKRAASVAGALKAEGLPAADFKLAAAGQTGAVNAAGQPRPMRRRADIILHLAAK